MYWGLKGRFSIDAAIMELLNAGVVCICKEVFNSD